jgi:hypothetical protein
MRRLAVLALLLLAALGCGTRIVLTIPKVPSLGAEAPATRPEAGCRYLNLLVDYSTQASGMSAKDVYLSAEIAEVMTREFERLGARVTEQPGEAYWSLMLMAIHNERDGGFIFSAMLGLRQLNESHDPGIATYASSGGAKEHPNLYTAVSYGSLLDAHRLAREYVHKADAALLPAARQLCSLEAQEQERHTALEAEVERPELPL